MEILDIYYENEIRRVEDKFSKDEDELFEKSPMAKAFNKIEAEYMEQMTKLAEESKKDDKASVKIIETEDHSFYKINNRDNEEFQKLADKVAEDRININKFIKLIKAHLRLCNSKEETESVLINYGLLNKKTGKLDV